VQFTVKSHIMQLLGYLVEYFKLIFNEDNVLAILKLCLDTLEEQLQLQQPVHVLLAGAIKCLDSILTWFDPSLPAGGMVWHVELCTKAFILDVYCLVLYTIRVMALCTRQLLSFSSGEQMGHMVHHKSFSNTR
jgi:hypothetical protein